MSLFSPTSPHNSRKLPLSTMDSLQTPPSRIQSLSARGFRSTPSRGAQNPRQEHQRTHSLTSQHFGTTGSILQSPTNTFTSPKHATFVSSPQGASRPNTGTLKQKYQPMHHSTHAPSDIPLTEIHASASLQLILFFNIFYSLCHFIFHVTAFIVRLSSSGGPTQSGYSVIGFIIHIVLLIITATGESLRLVAGFFGNMRERVPRLAAFMVLTAFMFPIQLGFVIGVRVVSLLELVSGIILLLFILLELVLGSFAIWKVVKVSSRRYHLQFNSDGTLYQDAEEGETDLGADIMYADEVETMERPSTAMSNDRPGTAMSGMSRPSSRSNMRTTPTSTTAASARGFSGTPMGNTQNTITITQSTPPQPALGAKAASMLRDRIRERSARKQQEIKFNVQQPSPESDEDA